jgi:dTDP-4-amino-4,6-dideoxygalactose transaminase
MGRLPGFLEHRARIYGRLWEGLSGIAELELIDSRGDDRLHASHYCLSAMLREPLHERREALIDALKAKGVGTSVYYPKSLPDTAYYARKYGYAHGSCPNATRISERSIAFPVGPHVSESDVGRIVETVKETITDV